MFLPQRTIVRATATQRQNLSSFPGVWYACKRSRVRNPIWVSEPISRVEWMQYEWEMRDRKVTKDQLRRWVDGVEETKAVPTEFQKRGYVSKVWDETGKEEKKRSDQAKDEGPEIDLITMRRKQQPKDKGPTVVVDERGFEAAAPIRSEMEQNQMEDVFKMPPPPPTPKLDNANTTHSVFQMPPPPPPVEAKTSNTEYVSQVPLPKKDDLIPPPLPSRGGSCAEQENVEENTTLASNPNPDLGLPRHDKTKETITGYFILSAKGAEWTRELVDNPTGTKIVKEVWNKAGAKQRDVSIPKTPPEETVCDTTAAKDHDADLETLLPRDVRAAMLRHGKPDHRNQVPSASASLLLPEETENSWHESFGSPELAPTSQQAYQTIQIPSPIPALKLLEIEARPDIPLPLLKAHAGSFFELSSTVTPFLTTNESELEWTGFDAPSSLSANSIYVFMLHITSSPTPFFAILSFPCNIPTPTAELMPTEALDFLSQAGTFLPYLRTARREGASLVHASRGGVSWAVRDVSQAWRLIGELENEGGGRGGVDAAQEILDAGVKGRTVKSSRRFGGGRIGRSMFWAGIWVGGLTGAIGTFTQGA